MITPERGIVRRCILSLLLIAGALPIGPIILQAQPIHASPQTRPTKVIVDFNSDDMLKKITVGAGVSISRTAKGALEVRIAPFSVHKNNWPLIAFGLDYFGNPINLSEFTKLEAVIHHATSGMSIVDFQVATPPNGAENVDDKRSMIPGNVTMTCGVSLVAIRNNDPSDIGLIQIIFRPRDIETVFLIEPIRGVYDPSIGSPAEALLAKVTAAQTHLLELDKNHPGAIAGNTDQKLLELDKRMASLVEEVSAARTKLFSGVLRKLSRRTDDVVSEIGKQRFIGESPLLIWTPDRYPNFERKTGPALQDEPLRKMTLQMAGNEFRDAVFMAYAVDHDMNVEIALRPTETPSFPIKSVDIRQADYLKNGHGEETGDALIPINGTVRIPAGESRQFWVRFHTRSNSITPGVYKFELVIRDDMNRLLKTIPVQVEVWDFALPSSDVLPVNSYAEFIYSDFRAGDGYRQAIQDMKLYGLNQLSLHCNEMPRPTGLDDQWKIIGYDDRAFLQRVNEALIAWKEAPGNEKLTFLFSLGEFEDLGLKKEGYSFPNAQWKAVLAQYLDHLKVLTAAAGIEQDRWMVSLRDESSVPALKEFDIPFAEAIKSIDPSIRIISNTSSVVSDPAWESRLFKVVDVFQPLRGSATVFDWMRRSGNILWVYECETDTPVVGHDMYTYYRVYPWDMLANGVVGTGLWTYCSHPPANWGEPGQGCLLIYKHPQFGLIHSRRYELFREGIDDFRYVAGLRLAAKAGGAASEAAAESLISDAIKDILENQHDHDRCESWRARIAARILTLKGN